MFHMDRQTGRRTNGHDETAAFLNVFRGHLKTAVKDRAQWFGPAGTTITQGAIG
jgi:hypothetical protein